jgi:SAM-dependent methyltransferase
MTSWYENDEFWSATEFFMFSAERYAAAKTEVESAVKLLSLKPGAKVLDLCCGPARHALELARRGYKVTGVDRTRIYLERAKKSAQDQDLKIEFIQEDMRRFVRPAAFDAVINLFTSFGFFEAEADNRQVLDNIYRSLKPGGSALFDTVSREIVKRDFKERDWVESGDGLLLEQRFVDKAWRWFEPRWIIIKDGKKKEFRWKIRLYSGDELRALLQKAGFKEVKLHGSLAGLPYDRKAKRLVAVARKVIKP